MILDYVMLQHQPGSIYSDQIYRCPSCGSGPVMAGDGFLMNRCLNCGRYQHATNHYFPDFSWIWRRASKAWKRVKRLFATSETREVVGEGDSMGGVK